MLIYKILRGPEWSEFQAAGCTNGAPVDLQDGFIHASTAAQVAETAAKHFAGEDGLVLLAIESDDLGDRLVWEESRGGQLFPHLYRALLLREIRWHCPLPLGPEGHVFPDNLS